jgi:glycerol-3-phosphate acyltransferase PlsX
MKVALDAMGGDHAPAAEVEGAALAVREYGVEVVLVGVEGLITEELRRQGLTGLPGLSVHHASQRVEMHERPSQVVRRKRDSSIWVAADLVKQGEAVAVISAGNTGATVITSFFLLGVLKGVERPAIATLLPTLTGQMILLDVGATVDCTAHHLIQFALMGHEYAQHVLNKAHPTIGLLSIGEEDTKGNEVTKETFKRLKESPLNFVGNVEGREIFTGAADVVVCDGFIGNVALKITEGVAEALKKMLIKEIAAGSFLSRMGYALLRPAFGRFKRRMDYAEFGGAPLLGVNGICIIAHGRSSGRAVKNAIRVAKEFYEGRVNEHIQHDIEESVALYGLKGKDAES